MSRFDVIPPLAKPAVDIWRSSLISTLTSVLALSATFTVSMLWALGVEVLPLVDKGHLLVLFAFYVSGITVIIRLVLAITNITWVMVVSSIEEWIGVRITEKIKRRNRTYTYYNDDIAKLAQRIARKRQLKNWHWYVLGSIPFLVLYGLQVRGPSMQVLSELQLGTGAIWLIFMAIMIGMNLAHVFFATKHKRHVSAYRFPLAFAQVMLLFAAFQAGSAWVEYLKEGAPTLEAKIAGWKQPITIRIALPASEGLLAFVAGSEDVTFIPWSRIDELKSTRGAPQPLPRLPDTISDTN